MNTLSPNRIITMCTPNLPTGLRPWLWSEDSLTRQLRLFCPNRLKVRLQQQHSQPPYRYEQQALDLKWRENALIRQVYLCCGPERWVFARTVIPLDTVRQRSWQFSQLAEQPLGDLLFRDPDIHRTQLTVLELTPQHPLYPSSLSEKPRLWGRISQFCIGTSPLLVQEVFLPDFMRAIAV